MGRADKCLVDLAGETLLGRIVETASAQVGPLVLNTNSDPKLFVDYDLPVASDVVDGYAGPLAGVLTGLEWARAHAPACNWVASFACDAPFAPRDLVARLAKAVTAEGAEMACAVSDGRDHPVFALWPVWLAEALRTAVVDEGVRKVDVFTGRYRLARASFDSEPIDPFFNINRPEDLARAETLLRTASQGKVGP